MPTTASNADDDEELEEAQHEKMEEARRRELIEVLGGKRQCVHWTCVELLADTIIVFE